MAAVSASSKPVGVANMAYGSFTGDGTITTVTCGFTPKRIHLINVTDSIDQIWQEGMAAATVFQRIAAGTGTAAAGTLLAPSGAGVADVFDGFTIAAAAAVTGKAYVWSAWG